MNNGLIDKEEGGFQIREKTCGSNHYTDETGRKRIKKVYGGVNREALWQVLRVFGIRRMKVNSLFRERGKPGDKIIFRIDNGVREECHVLLSFQCVKRGGNEKKGNDDGEHKKYIQRRGENTD